MKCAECGVEGYSTAFLNTEEKQRMDRDGLCFDCAFWSLRLEEGVTFVADGKAYFIGPEGVNVRWAGFGGEKFVIEFLDGRRVETHNLWHRGVVPEHFRARLPNTARRVPRKEW